MSTKFRFDIHSENVRLQWDGPSRFAYYRIIDAICADVGIAMGGMQDVRVDQLGKLRAGAKRRRVD